MPWKHKELGFSNGINQPCQRVYCLQCCYPNVRYFGCLEHQLAYCNRITATSCLDCYFGGWPEMQGTLGVPQPLPFCLGVALWVVFNHRFPKREGLPNSEFVPLPDGPLRCFSDGPSACLGPRMISFLSTNSGFQEARLLHLGTAQKS